MEMRVEQLAARAGVSVDTIRYYQSKGLLASPRRQGRVAWYDAEHVTRIARIRSLQARGFTLATIIRLLNGDLDAADEALLSELAGSRITEATHHPHEHSPDEPGHQHEHTSNRTVPADAEELELFTIEELALRTGVPLPLLRAVEAEGLLIPRRVGADERYTDEDVDAARAGLALLEWGVPLSALLELARRHHAATVSVASDAVNLFSTYIRGSLREESDAGRSDVPDSKRLVEAYTELLPAVTTLVEHHFTRALLKAALDHIEQMGTPGELQAVHDQTGDGDEAVAR